MTKMMTTFLMVASSTWFGRRWSSMTFASSFPMLCQPGTNTVKLYYWQRRYSRLDLIWGTQRICTSRQICTSSCRFILVVLIFTLKLTECIESSCDLYFSKPSVAAKKFLVLVPCRRPQKTVEWVRTATRRTPRLWRRLRSSSKNKDILNLR